MAIAHRPPVGGCYREARRLYAGEHGMERPGSIRLALPAVLMVKTVERRCSAFIFPNGNREGMPFGFGIRAGSVHGSDLSSGVFDTMNL